MRQYALKIGDHMIDDILRPRADRIDLAAIETRLRVMHRFSNDPKALTVHTHRALVSKLARLDGAPLHVQQWCWHHDDHESVTGDIPGPLKGLIATETNLLKRVEVELDVAICAARGIPIPSDDTRAAVHVYDKQAETIEWTHVLGQPLDDWNAEVFISPERQLEMLHFARQEP